MREPRGRVRIAAATEETKNVEVNATNKGEKTNGVVMGAPVQARNETNAFFFVNRDPTSHCMRSNLARLLCELDSTTSITH